LVFSCEKLKILKSWNAGKKKSLAKVKERGKKIMKDMAPYYNSRGAKKTIFIVRCRVNYLSKNLLSP
jgi:hypothetical protein